MGALMPIDSAELDELRQDCHLSPHEAAALCCVSHRTWQRWRQKGAPQWVGVVLRLRAGYLDDLGWKGWRIVKGRLVTNEWPYETLPGDIFAAWWQTQELVLSRSTLRQIDALPKVKRQVIRLVNKELSKSK